MMNPLSGSYLMMRELKGVEIISSSRLLIEPGRVMLEGSLPIGDIGGRLASPCGMGESVGLECASSDMEA